MPAPRQLVLVTFFCHTVQASSGEAEMPELLVGFFTQAFAKTTSPFETFTW